MAIAALILAAIYALLPTVISLFTMASTHAMKVIMDQRLFKIDHNVIAVLETIFGSTSSLNFIKNGPSLGTIISDLAMVIILVTLLLQIIDSYLKSLQGEPAENPMNILLRAIGTIFLEVLIFGRTNITWLPMNGVLYYFGNMMTTLINFITEDFNNLQSTLGALNFSIALLPAEQIVLIVMSFALFKSVVEAGIVFAERWLSFAFNILLGPVFVAFNASKQTSDTSKNWIISLFQQSFTMFLSYVILSMFYASMTDLEGITLGHINTTNNLLFKYALALALLALYKNSEKLLNLVGFRTISNMDTVRDYAKGIRAMGSLWRNTGGQVVSAYARQVGRQATGDMSHKFATYARDNFGENSRISKFANYMDTKPKTDAINKETGVTVSSNGNYKMPKAKTDSEKKLQSQSSKAVANMNRAINSGAGTPFSMKDSSLVNGLNQIDNLKTGSTGVIGEANRKVVTAAGKVKNEKVSAQIFQGTRVSDSGRESLPKTYGIVTDNKPLDVGTTFSLGHNKDGVELSYRIKNADPIPMQNGQGYMYELDSRPISKEGFENNTTLQDKYSGVYTDYLNDYASVNNKMVANLQADGFDYAWKNSASDKIAEEMFGGGNQQEKTLQRIYRDYVNEKEEYEFNERAKKEFISQLNDVDDTSNQQEFSEINFIGNDNNVTETDSPENIIENPSHDNDNNATETDSPEDIIDNPGNEKKQDDYDDDYDDTYNDDEEPFVS